MNNSKDSLKVLNIIGLLLIIIIIGCNRIDKVEVDKEPSNSVYEEKVSQSFQQDLDKKASVISYVHTTQRALSLVFNGLGNERMIEELLDELDKYEIKAVFFLPGMRVAEEPELAKEILRRGHQIGNNTLNRLDLTQLSYEEIYKEINRANEIIYNATGEMPKYMSPRAGNYNDEVLRMAGESGIEALITYSINPQDWDMKSAEAIAEYVGRFVTRGGIIALNTDINPEVIRSIGLINKAITDIGYSLVPLEELIENSYEKKPLKEIEGFDSAKPNMAIDQENYDLIYRINTDKKYVALTFDDWGSDGMITKMLDILEAYQVKAAFFLRGNGVENNPNLAKAIHEAGHEVANHTYTHPVITQISFETLQEEIIKCHQILTEALQEEPSMYFRPPTGEINDETAKVIAATGYKKIINYDVSPHDWNIDNTAEDIIEFIIEKVEPGSIILLHLQDGLATLDALPIIIEELHNRGYTFVSVNELITNK